jgi:hypothetical protein
MNLLYRLVKPPIKLPPVHLIAKRGLKNIPAMESIKLHNSLKPGAPVPFKPIEHGKIKWYACGPTVYDHSHLGHARNYVTTDVIRRILVDYFGFNVDFVMNYTDVGQYSFFFREINVSACQGVDLSTRC